ncbi:MAG: exonuclease [Gemmatimonadetes bacterium]|nr:MAG: exonuclease [Gemmatimonadota bacterium]
MLDCTFCHIPGVTPQTEEWLWSQGIHTWDDFLAAGDIQLPHINTQHIRRYLWESKEHLAADQPGYFSRKLPANQHWRLFPEFRYSAAYLDIETSPSPYRQGHYITTIALYNGSSTFCYVKGENLREFKEDIQQYKVIVSYNGKTFDVPIIERYLKIKLNHLTHIDLRYVLASLGYTGGLKQCEKRLGIHRQELDGINGRFAIHLWNDYQRHGIPQSLETLLAYNIADVVNLEKLMVIAYNKKLYHTTPFYDELRLDLPTEPEISIKPDPFTIDRIMREHGLYEANPYLYNTNR